jgi:HTH-type transcriptional regulator/antitoxin HigA
MTSGCSQFQPNYHVAPGDILQEWLDEQGHSKADLALRLGWDVRHLTAILNGVEQLSAECSGQLEGVTAIPALFWSNMEARYQENRSRSQ